MQRLFRETALPVPRVLIASAVALLVGFLVVVQLRSQAVVVRHLEGQDNTTIALLINNLNRSNTSLREEIFNLESQRSRLQAGLSSGQGDPEELDRQTTRLRIVNGTLPVHGPGIVLRIDGRLRDFELQDIVNNLRNAGVEALALNGHRVVGRTVIRARSGSVDLEGAPMQSPYAFKAIGDAQALYDAAQLSLGALEGRAIVEVRRLSDVQIAEAALPQRFVYAQASR